METFTCFIAAALRFKGKKDPQKFGLQPRTSPYANATPCVATLATMTGLTLASAEEESVIPAEAEESQRLEWLKHTTAAVTIRWGNKALEPRQRLSLVNAIPAQGAGEAIQLKYPLSGVSSEVLPRKVAVYPKWQAALVLLPGFASLFPRFPKELNTTW